MAVDDDDVSLSSNGSSSSEESSIADTAKTSRIGACESYFRQSIFFGLLLVAASVIIATFILVIKNDNEDFHSEVSLLRLKLLTILLLVSDIRSD